MHPRWMKHKSRKRKTRKSQGVPGEGFFKCAMSSVPPQLVAAGDGTGLGWTQAGNSWVVQVHPFTGTSEWMCHWYRPGRGEGLRCVIEYFLCWKHEYSIWASRCVFQFITSGVLRLVPKRSCLSQSKSILSVMTGLKAYIFLDSRPRSGWHIRCYRGISLLLIRAVFKVLLCTELFSLHWGSHKAEQKESS